MAVAVDAYSSATFDTDAVPNSTNVNFVNHTVGAALSSGALIGMIHLSSATLTGMTCQWDATGTPQTMAQLIYQTSGSGSVAIFGLVAPTAGNKTMRFSFTGGGGSDVGIFACSFTGVNQSGGASSFTTVGASGSSTTPTLTIASATANRIFTGASALTLFNTPGGGLTQRYNDTVLTNINYQGADEAGAASLTPTQPLAGTSAWAMAAVNVIAAGAADVLAAQIWL